MQDNYTDWAHKEMRAGDLTDEYLGAAIAEEGMDGERLVVLSGHGDSVIALTETLDGNQRFERTFDRDTPLLVYIPPKAWALTDNERALLAEAARLQAVEWAKSDASDSEERERTVADAAELQRIATYLTSDK